MINQVKAGQATQVQADQVAVKTPSIAESVANQARQNTQESKGVQVNGDKVEIGKGFAPLSQTYGKKLTSEQVATLKSQSERKLNHLSGLVDQMLGQQAKRTGKQAKMTSLTSQILGANQTEQADVSEDKEWGVEAVSDRIVKFAQQLAGGDMSKFDKLSSAIEKGIQMATKSLGGKLPGISEMTVDSIRKKMNAWKEEMTSKTAQENQS